jgi:hypothetical protein
VSNDRIGQRDARTPSVCDIRVGHAVEDPRVTALRAAIGRLGRELTAYPYRLPERQVALEELASLDARAAAGTLSVPGLRASLLVVAGALGSVSVLSASLRQVHRAIDLFGAA